MPQLFKHQEAILKEFPHKKALVWSTGTGKTIAAIELVKKGKKVLNYDFLALFICPKGLRRNWEIQLEKAKIGRYALFTKEEFKATYKSIAKAEAVIIDEAHNVFGMSSLLSKAVSAYLKHHSPEFIWLLTATPYRSSPWDVYRMGVLLGHEVHYMEFRNKFFQEVRFGNRRPVPVVRKGIEDEIAKLVSTYANVVRLDECADVPEQTFEVEYFELTSNQKKMMLSVYDVQPIVRFTAYHQICGGTLKGNGYEPTQTFGTDKIDRLLSLVEENKRMIVVCRYNAEIDMLKEVLSNSDKVVGIIRGDVKDRHTIIEQLKVLDEYVLLVNAACSEGWELPECPLMVFYSYDFSSVNYIQMLGRIQRINNIKKNTYLSLVIKDSIDEDIYECVKRKETFNIEIYDKERMSALPVPV